MYNVGRWYIKGFITGAEILHLSFWISLNVRGIQPAEQNRIQVKCWFLDRLCSPCYSLTMMPRRVAFFQAYLPSNWGAYVSWRLNRVTGGGWQVEVLFAGNQALPSLRFQLTSVPCSVTTSPGRQEMKFNLPTGETDGNKNVIKPYQVCQAPLL